MGKGIKKKPYLSVGNGGMREGIDRRGRGSWCLRGFVAELIRPV